MYDAEDFFELLNSHYQEITLDNPVDIWKQNPQDKAEEPEPRLQERTMVVLKLTGFTTADINVFQNNDLNK